MSTEVTRAEASATSTRREGVDAHDSRGGLIIYRPADDTVHHLNPVSTLFYELSDGRTLESIARSLEVVLSLDAAEARRVAQQAFDELAAADLVS
jgi:hypothetical protein